MAEENVNGSAPGLQSLNWIGSHTDTSAVTYRYLPMTVACKQLQPHFLGEKQYLLSLRKMRLAQLVGVWLVSPASISKWDSRTYVQGKLNKSG